MKEKKTLQNQEKEKAPPPPKKNTNQKTEKKSGKVENGIHRTRGRAQGAAGIDWGVLAAAGVLTIVPGALVIYFVRNYIAKGFALGRV